MKSSPFTLRSRLLSFRFAAKGICTFFRQEHNARIHLAATVTLITGIVYFHISGLELVALLIVAGLVWAAEIMNTAVEQLVDWVSPGFHPKAGLIKDLASAAVLVLSVVALITGLIIFIPKITGHA